MHVLTEAQKSKVRQLNNASFEQYCLARGYDLEQQKAYLLALARSKYAPLLEIVDFERIPSDPPYLQTALKAIAEATEFFEIYRAHIEWRRQAYACRLAKFADNLPIDEDYVTRLCRRLHLPEPAAGKAEAVLMLMQSIPLISCWDLEFNAFVSSTSAVDGLPCVSIYEMLLATSDTFLACVVPPSLALATRSKQLPFERNIKIATNAKFRRRLEGCLNMLLGHSDQTAWRATKKDLELHWTVRTMVDGAIEMVWFHEFGHLLRGHLEEPQSHRIEFEADEFALSVFARNQDDPRFDTWSGLGGITVFVLLDILEAIERRTESISHPSAEHRLKAALEFFDRAKIDVARKAPGYLWAVAAICNPTLEAKWGVSINYDWTWPMGASG